MMLIMPIQVRVDDFPGAKDAERYRHNLTAYRRFHEVLRGLLGGRRYLLGVIPYRCLADELAFIRDEAPSLDILVGLHGLDHSEKRLDFYENEFAPHHTTREVARSLDAGWSHICNYAGPPGVYLPPRNRIDERTVQALKQVGFSAFTTGPETDPSIRERHSDMCLHSQVPFEYGRSDELLQRGAQAHLIQECDAGRTVTLTLHFPWETNLGNDYTDLKHFLGAIPQSYFQDFTTSGLGLGPQ